MTLSGLPLGTTYFGNDCCRFITGTCSNTSAPYFLGSSSIYCHAYLFSGNIAFRHLVKRYKTRYRIASRNEKVTIVNEVIAEWKNREPPGRFVAKVKDKSKGDLWEAVSEGMAKKRAAKSLAEWVKGNSAFEEGKPKAVTTAKQQLGNRDTSSVVSDDQELEATVKGDSQRSRRAADDEFIQGTLPCKMMQMNAPSFFHHQPQDAFLDKVSLAATASIGMQVQEVPQSVEQNPYSLMNDNRKVEAEGRSTFEKLCEELPPAAELASVFFEGENNCNDAPFEETGGKLRKS